MLNKLTPWGRADYSEEIAPGIIFYGTPSHGGIELSPERQASMPDALRTEGAWYEEDCDYALVFLAFPAEFSDPRVAAARETVKNWHPARFETFTGETIAPGDSYIKDRDRHRAKHLDNYVVRTAWGAWHVAVPRGQVGVRAVRERDGDAKYFLVAAAEYKAHNGRLSFVVDPVRHAEVDDFDAATKALA